VQTVAPTKMMTTASTRRKHSWL